MNVQAVLVFWKLSDEDFGTDEERQLVYDMEDELDEAITEELGELDGHEFGGGQAVFYLYGPNADTLFDAVKPIFERNNPPAGSYVTLRYGPAEDPTAREVTVPLDAQPAGA